MDRMIKKPISDYLNKKIILITGPRQVGKTTLSKSFAKDFSYYNYDIKEHLSVFLKNEWDRTHKLVIFDEVHKKRNWKLWLKGLYDAGELKKHHIVVTGSARLDIAKKMGDSLAGRFFSFRLNPLDLKELKWLNHGTPEKNYQNLLKLGGFPEPFFESSEKFYNIWKKTHTDLILRQDLITYETVRDIDSLEVLIEMLSTRVGSNISINSLSEDLSRDEKTIKKWLEILENLFVIFKLPPYSKNIARSLKKSSKYYFYDIPRVKGDESAKLENLVALSLKKEIEFLQDTEGLDLDLRYIRTKDKKEIDFLVLKNAKPFKLIEVKLSETNVSPSFFSLEKYFNDIEKIQLVKNFDSTKITQSGVKVISATKYLTELDLSK